ncbi:MAG: hypothetical protein KUG77_20410 [Nannocystaceae bacterium]|nr:hypothetical protein [Nannocystaceae bacterium]
MYKRQEFAFPQYVAYAAVVETDAKRHVAVIPSVELVPSWGGALSLFPMPSVGVGAPVQVWPDVRGGFRGQAGLGWFFFAILGSVDVYPATPSDPMILRGALVAQFSF